LAAPADIDVVSAALRRIPDLPAWQPATLAVTPLQSLTNHNFQVALAGARYVLRLPRPGTAAYIDRAAEAHNARLVAGLGLAPELVFFDPQDGVMLTRFVEGAAPLTPALIRDEKRLDAAADLLRRLHGSGLQFRGEMHLFPMLDRYLELAGDAGPEASALAAARRASRPVEAALAARPEGFVPCHIDPSPQNFLAAPGRMYLLDWEYAAMCEPLWDVAGLSNEAGLDAEGDAALLARYFGAPTPRQEGRFTLLKAMLELLAASWGSVQAAQGNDSFDFAADVRRRLARFDAALGAPALGARLAAVR
jgi:thiamine kinase-like enzyme